MRINREQFLRDLVKSDLERKNSVLQVANYILDLDAQFSSGISSKSLCINLQMPESSIKKCLMILKQKGFICFRKSNSKYYVGPKYHEAFNTHFEIDNSICYKRDIGKKVRETEIEKTGIKIWIKGQNKYA